MTTVEEDITVDELVEVFIKHKTEAALAAIPRTSGHLMHQRVPWWTNECSAANGERKRALKLFQRTRLLTDKIT